MKASAAWEWKADSSTTCSLTFTHQQMIAMMRSRTYSIKNLSGRIAPVRETTSILWWGTIGRETSNHPTIGKYNLHKTTKKMAFDWLILLQADKWRSGVRISCTIHLQTWHSPDGRIFNQINHSMIDWRHFSDVNDVKA
jgi:hypothetical protein